VKTHHAVTLKKCLLPLFFAAVFGLLTTGCRTYQQQNQVIMYWHQGNMTNAVAEATKMANKNETGKDAIIWHLEQGAVLRGAGKYEESNKVFDEAQGRIDQYSQEAKVKVGAEAGALFSNQANLPYRGRSYDGIMLNTYKALNYLQLGEPDKARVELIRAYQRQQEAVEDNQKRIAKVQAEVDASTNKAAIDKAQEDPKFKSQMQGAYTNFDNLKPYADYVNPFTVYLDGLFFMANAADASDLERAHKSLERVVSFDPNNEYVKQDLATVDSLIQGKPLAPTTYVIFETGCAPVRDQVRIDIPILVAKVSYVGAAFPTLKPEGNYLPSLAVTANVVTMSTNLTATASDTIVTASGTTTVTNETTVTVSTTTTATNDAGATVTSTTATTNETAVAANGTTSATNDPAVIANSTTTTTVNSTTVTTNNLAATTSLVASMDSVIGLDFKNDMPVVITKTIAATVAKAVAAYALNDAANQQGAVYGLISMIGTGIYQAAVNIADERTWTTLPKEFQVCRIPTPPDRKLELEVPGPGGTQKIPVTIGDGTINIVYVKSITAASPLLVTQMKLK